MSDYHSKTFQKLHINSDMSVVCVVFWNDFACFFSRMIWIFFLDWFGFVWNDLDLFGRICLKKQMEWFGFVWNDLFFCFAIMCNDVVLWASVSLEFSWMFWTFFFWKVFGSFCFFSEFSGYAVEAFLIFKNDSCWIVTLGLWMTYLYIPTYICQEWLDFFGLWGIV